MVEVLFQRKKHTFNPPPQQQLVEQQQDASSSVVAIDFAALARQLGVDDGCKLTVIYKGNKLADGATVPQRAKLLAVASKKLANDDGEGEEPGRFIFPFSLIQHFLPLQLQNLLFSWGAWLYTFGKETICDRLLPPPAAQTDGDKKHN